MFSAAQFSVPQFSFPGVSKSPEIRVDMRARQDPLMRCYKIKPELARIVDSATTSSREVPTRDAVHGQVTTGTGRPVTLDTGIHTAVGGECDDPNPGELLSAAIASCLDSTIRIVANRLGLPLRSLSVSVDASVDVRGTLRVSKDVPVGFQSIDIQVAVEPLVPVSEQQIAMLIGAAEKSCVVLQTIMSRPTITVSRQAA